LNDYELDGDRIGKICLVIDRTIVTGKIGNVPRRSVQLNIKLHQKKYQVYNIRRALRFTLIKQIINVIFTWS